MTKAALSAVLVMLPSAALLGRGETISLAAGDSLAAVQLRARRVAKPVTVELGDGLYHLSEPLLFEAADSGVTWCAAKGAHPVVTGGERLRGWKRNADGTWSAAVPKNRPFRQLAVNGRLAVRCREPNVGEFLAAGDTLPYTGRHTAGAGRHPALVYDPKDVDFAKIADPKAGEIRLFHWWADSHLTISRVNAESNTVFFTVPASMSTGKIFGGKMARYRLENYRQFLDRPGEWYLDAAAGRVDYLPRPGENPADPGFVAIAARQKTLLRFKSDASARQRVTNLTFRGISFADADAEASADDPINNGQGACGIASAIVFDGARNCRFERCAFTRLNGYAIDIVGGSRDLVFSRCRFTDLGGGGIRINGGNFAASPLSQTRGIVIEDCEIGPYGLDWASAEGVLVMNAAQCRVAHNHIHDGYYTAISLGWSWGYGDSVARDNVVECNLIEDIGKELLNDMGGIYTLGLSPGTVLRNNVIRRVTSWSYGGNCIYLDEGSSGILIENNLLCDSPELLNPHYVREITVRNNIFARQGGDMQLRGGILEPHVSLYLYGNIFYFTHGAPLTSWGMVPHYTVFGWSSPVEYVFPLRAPRDYDEKLRVTGGAKRTDHVLGDWNVFWNPNGADPKVRDAIFDGKVNRHSRWADPLFVDVAKDNWNLRPESPALELGFEPIDFSAVGPRPAR